MRSKIAVWAAQVRAPFLLLAVVLVLIGGALAFHQGQFPVIRFILCMAGTILAHASVNLFNELSDYRTGIDARTRRTPFSGGSGNLQSGDTTPSQVRLASWGTLTAAGVIGVYLSWVSDWNLLFVVLAGALATVFYTTFLARIGLGEFFAGVALGSLVVIGTFVAMTGAVTATVILISVPPGILTALLLYLNEFPDLEADRAGGRRHLVILLGRKKASIVYVAAMAGCYLHMAVGILAGWFPGTLWIAFLTLPLAFKASMTALKDHENFEKMVSALGANVGTVLFTDLLIAIAFFWG